MRWSPKVGWKKFFKDLYREWNDDSVGTTAAALTFYGVLSLFPFLVFVVTIAGLVLDPTAIEGLLAQLGRFAPEQAVTIVGDRLKALHAASGGGLLTVGFVGALWAASGAAYALMQALNRCYDVRETRPWWKTRLLAIGITFGAAVMGVLAAAITFAVPVVAKFLGDPLGDVLTLLRFPVAGVIMMGLWGFLYWVMPNVKPKFQLVTPGSVVGVLVWLLASWGFTQYVRNFGKYEATYGALGGVIVMLLWMWISSMVVLLGAEINKLLTPQEKLQYNAATGEKAGVDGKEKPIVATPKEEKEAPRPGEPQPA